MGIYIPDVSLPKEGDFELWISIRKDCSFAYNVKEGWQNGKQKAISVPQHGRLIDAQYIRDAIIQKWMDKAGDSHMYKCGMEDAYEVIRNAPTVIPAEEAK